MAEEPTDEPDVGPEEEGSSIPNEELLGTPMSPSDVASKNVETVEPEVMSSDGMDPDLLRQAEKMADLLMQDSDILQGLLSQPAGTSASSELAARADPELVKALEDFKYGATIPKAGTLHSAYAFKYDYNDKDKIIYDILISVRDFNETLTKWPVTIQTPYGPLNDSGYIIWNKIVGMSYDEVNKRMVPVKKILMTPAWGFKEVDAIALSKTVNTDMILETIDAVDTHRTLIVAEEGRTAKKEAKTYKDIVDRIYNIAYPEAVEDMTSKAMEAEDRGDKSMKSAFTVEKDIWEQIKENWCWILLAIIFVAVMLYASMGGGA